MATKPKNAKGIRLTYTMLAFLQHLADEGRGLDQSDVVRALVVAEMKRWEDLNRKPFPPVPANGSGSDAVDLSGE
jgi:hypothetical protein